MKLYIGPNELDACLTPAQKAKVRAALPTPHLLQAPEGEAERIICPRDGVDLTDALDLNAPGCLPTLHFATLLAWAQRRGYLAAAANALKSGEPIESLWALVKTKEAI